MTLLASLRDWLKAQQLDAVLLSSRQNKQPHLGIDPTRILVMSQVLLSFGIALALVPLLIFTSDSKLMGDLVNSKRVKQTGWVIVVLVVALNIWLLVGTALGL